MTDLKRVAPVMPVVGAALAVAGYVAALPCPHPRGVAVLAALVLVGAVECVGRACGAATFTGTLLHGARIAWPAATILLALPFATRAPGALDGHLAAAIALAATLVLARRADRAGSSGIPILAAPLRGRWIGAWEAALLLVAVATAVHYVQIGAAAEGNFENDAAYYYGVARHMALAKRLEEPIVWHFVAPPPTLVHAPFDYWGPLTSLVLAPVLAIFGATQRVAFIAMAAVSGASVIAFWYLVCVVVRVRYPVLQLLGLLCFAFSASARDYRFDTESLPLYHLLLIGLMLALARGRLLLAIATAFLLLLCRNDGVLAFILVSVYAMHRLRGAPVALRRAAVLAGGLLALYVARNAWSFGTMFPPGAAAGALMANESQLYLLHRSAESSWRTAIRVFGFPRLQVDVDGALAFFTLPVVPARQLWYVVAASSTMFFRRRLPALPSLIPALALAATLLLAWASGPMFHWWRTMGAILPLIVLALIHAASGAFDAIIVVARRSRRLRPAWALGASALVFCFAYPVVTRLEPYEHREKSTNVSMEAELARLDGMFAGAPVASQSPWFVMAHTRSPVVSIPGDGPEAVAEVIRRYGVEWIVARDVGTSRDVPRGSPIDVGGVEVEQLPGDSAVHVFRVVHR